ncbi:hypothetical protein BDA99DRAFT_538934 [Phascolomyces articulosus]|uniref:Uncharacterized protein n=1 Tax=Phascolomyces articulosus TaxID=60185 RepID=A0AAD5JXH4_9FUNG|nr:hypothetical protein BDA99DRAFT_538934 [Phascolomyces articulosus]
MRGLLIYIVALATIFPYYSYAYCVYNKMGDKTKINVSQMAGQARFALGTRSFHHYGMPSGSKECCPYTDGDCCDKPDPDSEGTFFLSYYTKEEDGGKRGKFTYTVPFKCGGYVVTTGKIDSFSYHVYSANHTRVAVRGPEKTIMPLED